MPTGKNPHAPLAVRPETATVRIRFDFCPRPKLATARRLLPRFLSFPFLSFPPTGLSSTDTFFQTEKERRPTIVLPCFSATSDHTVSPVPHWESRGCPAKERDEPSATQSCTPSLPEGTSNIGFRSSHPPIHRRRPCRQAAASVKGPRMLNPVNEKFHLHEQPWD